MLSQWLRHLLWFAALSWRVAAEDKDGIKSIPVSNAINMKSVKGFDEKLIVLLVTDA